MLCSNFNRTKDDEHYQMLKENFLDDDSLYLERAIKKIIQEDKYFPSVARIKEVLDEMYEEPLTKDEKLKRWEKEGITPSCLNKEPEEIKISDEEMKELEKWIKKF
jgi:hypothetical protein